MLNSYPFAPQLEGIRDTIKKQSFVFNSGMACYDAFLKSYKLTTSSRPTILFMRGCYFELTVEKTLSDYIHREFETKKYDEETDQDCDIFCLDLYPNYAPLLEVRVNDVVSLVRQHLKPGKKLTVILDTSTTIAWNDQVARIMEAFKNEIQNGTLTFVVINSLAKFSMCGFDKYPGGITQTYCQVTGSNTSELNQNLNFQVDKKIYSLSPEAYRFFSFFIKDNKEQIEKYIKTVNDGTDYVYQKLQHLLQRKDAYLRLGVRDNLIPMMGLHFDSFLRQLALKAGKKLSDSEIDEILPNLVYFMYYFLYAQANKRGLPLLIRPSFGFPHAAFTECWSAIRLTIGAEDNVILDAYVRFFETVDYLMSNFITQANHSEIKALLNLVTHPPKFQEKSSHLGQQTESHPSPTMRKFIEHHEPEVLKSMQEGTLSACLAQFMRLAKH